MFLAQTYFKLKRDLLDEQHYDFDAFLAYNEDDIKWVKQELLPRLDEKYRICLHHRDFTLGVPIEENIVNAIAKSRKTILIITKKFVQSTWCQFEVRMAREKVREKGRDILIPILLEQLDYKSTTGTICNILKQNTFLEYTDDEEGRKVFWKKLVRSLEGKSDYVY